MSVYYVETSAWFKRYRLERGTEVVDELFDGRLEADDFTTSYFGILEATAVATGYRRARILRERGFRRLLESIAIDADETMLIYPVTQQVLTLALTLIPAHGLRAPDAVHLATVQVLKDSTPRAVYFLVSDGRLKTAARSIGISVIDPEDDDALQLVKDSRAEH